MKKLLIFGFFALAVAGCSHHPTRLPPETISPEAASPNPPSEPIPGELPEADSRLLTFYLEAQQFDYVEDDEVVLSGPIASGKAQSPTPKGAFRVLSKHKDKVSSKYDNEIGTPAWMPYSLQFYGNYFIHEGWLPGHPASHGCIRLGHKEAKFLFERMKIGDPVKVQG